MSEFENNLNIICLESQAFYALVEKLVGVLDTTVGYLLRETEGRELLKAPSMMRRLNDISKFPEQDT